MIKQIWWNVNIQEICVIVYEDCLCCSCSTSQKLRLSQIKKLNSEYINEGSSKTSREMYNSKKNFLNYAWISNFLQQNKLIF